ncbi:hypothetical protein C8A03DRAFT_12829, partial [Achaetomium macrosporum]
NVRKRRAYCPEEASAEPVFHGLTYSSPTGHATLSFPADHQYILQQPPLSHVLPTSYLEPNLSDPHLFILEQAAILLNQPLDSLLNLSNQQHPYASDQDHFHKKPRLDPTIQMPASYSSSLYRQDGQEKPLLGGQPGAGVITDHRASGLFGGWTGSRLADCFASFSMCSTSESQPSYQPLVTPPPYDYDDRKPPALDTAMVSVRHPSQTSLLPTPVTSHPTGLFPCDDPALMAQYMSNQPSHVLGLQPAASREEMVYPSLSAATDYEGSTGGRHGASCLAIHPPPYLTEVPLQADAVSGACSAGSRSSPSSGHGVLMNLPSHFHSAQVCDVIPGAESTAVQEDFLPTQRTTPVKRGPFKDQDSREKTALTRKMGSCIRCRMQRIRCNLDPDNERGPCLSCKKIASTTRVYRLNCLRLKITDVKLFKPGQVKGQEWTNRWKDNVMDDIGNWESSQVRTIYVTEGYTGQSVRLQVRQFKPQPGDSLERRWVSKDGAKRTVKIPAFAIVNLDDAKAAFDQYIKQGLLSCCDHLLGPRDKLLWRTYTLAINLANDTSTPLSERSLLVATLDLWMSVRLTTKSFEIVGDDTLDMPRDIIKDQDNPLHGKIPLPPVMGAQIDSVIIHQIQPRLRRKALEELQKMTQEKKQKTWLTTYLVTFILLHNIALITKHDADYAKKHGLNRRFAREAHVKEYNMGANTLLAYFHYCNKAIYPFSAECKDQDLQTLAELDDEAISFVRYTRRVVAQNKNEWQGLWLREDYENEFYYVSQLFEHNWQPRTMA